jgi:hypothetical protein
MDIHIWDPKAFKSQTKKLKNSVHLLSVMFFWLYKEKTIKLMNGFKINQSRFKSSMIIFLT